MYRNVCTYVKDDEQHVWESTFDEKGNRIELDTVVRPYMYYEDKNSKDRKYVSMYGNPLRKLEFTTSAKRQEAIEKMPNVPLFEKLSPDKQYLIDKYYGKERDAEFMQFPLRVFYMDIEVEIDNVFPDPDEANYPINVISIFDTQTNVMYVWTYRKDVDKWFDDDKIKRITDEIHEKYFDGIDIDIRRFDNEQRMMDDFIDFWKANIPDVITGWNIDGFDIKYIMNRFVRIYGDKRNPSKFMSPLPWNKNAVKMVQEQKNKQTVTSYHILGVTICDYLTLYKKFVLKSQQSYKLDYIAKMETGLGKLDYFDMGYESMQDFMRADFTTFVKYNIIDTLLVKKIDNERHFIELMRRICNMGLCGYENIFRSIPYILGSLVIVARQKGVKFLTDANRSDDNKFESEGFEGAFVYPTQRGYYKNGIVSFDFNSLYPNVIMSLNISPETYVGKIITNIGEEIPEEVKVRKRNGKIVTLTKSQFENVLENECSISSNNVLFVKPKKKFGIMPTFLDGLYKSRKSIKKKCKENEQLAKDLGDRIRALEEELKTLEQ